MTTEQRQTHADLRTDFKVFLYALWKFLGLPKPTPVQYQIADYLQNGPRKIVIEAFRGVGKSWITGGFVVWALWLDPTLKFLIVSASKGKADEFAQYVKRIIMTWDLVEGLRPESAAEEKEGRWANEAFDVRGCGIAQAPSVRTRGVTGAMTGGRADIIIPDDIETPGNSNTPEQRDKVKALIREFENILKPTPKASIKYLGTPHTEESLYNFLVDERGYEGKFWPGEVPTTDEIPNYQGRLHPMYVKMAGEGRAGEAADPARFTKTVLEDKKSGMGLSGYRMQFMLDTTLSDAERYPLRARDLIVMDLDPQRGPTDKVMWSSTNKITTIPNIGFIGDFMVGPMIPPTAYRDYEGSVMYIDPSGRGKDETSCVCVNQLGGSLFVVGSKAWQGDGFEEKVLVAIAHEAARCRVNRVLVEDNYGGGMFTQLLAPVLGRIWPVTLEDVNVQTRKEERIIGTLEPVMNGHRLIIDKTLVEQDVRDALADPSKKPYSLIYQLTHLTKDKGALRHDDRLDALAGAVAYWVESMSRDRDKSVEAYKNKALADALEGFVSGIKSGKSMSRMGAKTKPKKTSRVFF